MSHNEEPAASLSGRTASRAALAGLAVVILCFWLARLFSAPPSLVPADAPAGAFSGARALEWSKRIEGEGRPHPVGSAENARVRGILVTELSRLGFAVEEQSRLVVGRNGVIAVVNNVIATLAGRESGPRVLLCAHHDSVPAGPGASDDGSGTAAILEIARALRAGPPLRNGIVLLIDDGEEAGLLGARAFVADHPLAKEIGAVLNFEARGTCGRAHMFETSEDNAWLVDHYARAVPHPAAISVAYELYKRLPNDTDMTVFKGAGLAGLNFAFIGGLSRYHTPLDDVAHLDPRSLQHVGESGLALARSLGDADLAARPRGNAVYTDVLGLFFLHWPESFCTPIAAAALLALLFGARGARMKPLLFGVLAAIVALVAATAAAHGIALAIVALRGVDAPWTAHPWPARCAVVGGALATALLIGRLVLRRGSRAFEARVSAHLLIALLGLVAAILVPSASYLLLGPALFAALSTQFWRQFSMGAETERERVGTLGHVLPVAIAALSVGQLLVGLEEAFELRMGAALGAPIGIVALLLAPSWIGARARVPALLAAASLVAFVIALVLPAHDAHAPGHVNLGRITDSRSGSALWGANPYGVPLPEELAKAGDFAPPTRPPVEWWPLRRASFVSPAEPSKERPPELEVLRDNTSGGRRVIVARLTSPRGALRFAVHVPERTRLRAVRWRDQRLEVDYRPLSIASFTGIPVGGVELELEVEVAAGPSSAGGGAIDVDLLDATPLDANAAKTLLDARPAETVPRGEGDVDVILARVRL